MSSLEITFGTFIRDYEAESPHTGALFSHWLPDGERDAITLSLNDENATVGLWHERRGYVEGPGHFNEGLLVYDAERDDFDEELMRRQAVVDGGAVFGRIALRSIDQDSITAVLEGRTGTDPYVALGRRVVTRILQPTLALYAAHLRHTLGQYWLGGCEPWDSRQETLGSYCSHFRMQWTAAGRSGLFLPTEKGRSVVALTGVWMGSEGRRDLIDEPLWRGLEGLLQEGQPPPLEAEFSSRANRLLHERRYSHALIECVTSLEIAVQHRVKLATRGVSKPANLAQMFSQDLRLPAQVAVVASLLGAGQAAIEAAIRVIERRNQVVHDGVVADRTVVQDVRTTLDLVRLIADQPLMRFPRGHESNALSGTEGEH